MTDKPVVSAIIPTYNRAHTLRETVDSALDQTYAAVEVVVVDDGSTDETGDVLADLPSDVVVVRQANGGVSSARNAGIGASSGSIVMFLDSDDLWMPHAVSTQVGILEAAGSSAPCSMCDLVMRAPDGTEVTMFADRRLRPTRRFGRWTNVQDVLTSRFLFTNQTLAIRRSALDDAGPFDESLWVMEDFDLALRLSALGAWAFTDEVLAIRRDGSANSLTSIAMGQPERLHQTTLAICDKARSAGILTSARAKRANDYMARKASRAAKRAVATGRGTATVLDAQSFVEQGVVERAYRNSPLYPRLESTPW